MPSIHRGSSRNTSLASGVGYGGPSRASSNPAVTSAVTLPLSPQDHFIGGYHAIPSISVTPANPPTSANPEYVRIYSPADARPIGISVGEGVGTKGVDVKGKGKATSP